MKFTTLALLPTAAFAAHPLLSLLPRQEQDLTAITAAIDNTTTAVTGCTSAISSLQFKPEGNNDYSQVETSCGAVGYGIQAIFTQLTSSVNLTNPAALLSLQPLEQPLRNLMAEFEKFGMAFVSKQEGFVNAEICPLMEKYGPQLQAEVAGMLQKLSETAKSEEAYLFGQWFKDADQWAQSFPGMYQQFVQQWCGSAASNSTGGGAGNGTSTANGGSQASGNGTGAGGSDTAPIPAAAAGLVPQAGMALVAVAGAVLLL